MPTSPKESPRVNRGRAAGPENRRALIAAAREVYAEQGLAAPFSAVAKRAGVGQGSLYRHFPDRTALAVAVFDDNVAALEAVADADGRTIDDLLDAVVAQSVVSTAFIELVAANRHDPRVEDLGIRFRGLVARLVDRERSAGRIGAHIDADDVTMLTGMLATELARTDPADRADVAARARALFDRALAPHCPRASVCPGLRPPRMAGELPFDVGFRRRYPRRWATQRGG